MFLHSFEGTMVPSRGQAALLTFCTCISLGSVGLVLSIAVPEGGNNWFWLMTLSPLAYVIATLLAEIHNETSSTNVVTVPSWWSRGVYYWRKASRKEEMKVKMILSDGGNVSEVLVQGDDVQVEQMRKELKFSEKGMIYVKGIFETWPVAWYLEPYKTFRTNLSSDANWRWGGAIPTGKSVSWLQEREVIFI